jgi:Ca2+-binding EF-hand superfamily protein
LLFELKLRNRHLFFHFILILVRFTLKNPSPAHFVTTAESSYATQPLVPTLLQPKTRRAPASSLVNGVDVRYYNAEDPSAAAEADHVGVFPMGVERLGYTRASETKAEFGPRKEGKLARETHERAQAAVEDELRRSETSLARPLVVPTPVQVGVHFQTTSGSAHQYWNPDEYAQAGSNADTSSNPVTVWSMQARPPPPGKGVGGKHRDVDLETSEMGLPTLAKVHPSTFVPKDVEGMRVTGVAPTATELAHLKAEARYALHGAGSAHARHLRTTYTSDFVRKEPALHITVDEGPLDDAKAAVRETIRRPEANPRDTKNSAYGSLGPLGVLPPTHAERVVASFRDRLRAAGISTLAKLTAVFRAVDITGDSLLDMHEFHDALARAGIAVTDDEAADAFVLADLDGSGYVRVGEFLQLVRGPLPERRLASIDLAFGKLDVDKNGYLDAGELREYYNPASDPVVASGRKRETQAIREFIAQFEGAEKDGIVTKDEFRKYAATNERTQSSFMTTIAYVEK